MGSRIFGHGNADFVTYLFIGRMGDSLALNSSPSQPFHESCDTRLGRCKKVDDFFGCHVLAVVRRKGVGASGVEGV
jgi:hypothetical protein